VAEQNAPIGAELEVELVTLVDEDDVEQEYEVLDRAELDGVSYVALTPVFDDPGDMLDDPGELIILRVAEEDGEEVLDTIDDDAEYSKVGDYFMERLADQFDIEEE
jgi:uncharacterized protein YrzB (UPF0473 family)